MPPFITPSTISATAAATMITRMTFLPVVFSEAAASGLRFWALLRSSNFLHQQTEIPLLSRHQEDERQPNPRERVNRHLAHDDFQITRGKIRPVQQESPRHAPANQAQNRCAAPYADALFLHFADFVRLLRPCAQHQQLILHRRAKRFLLLRLARDDVYRQQRQKDPHAPCN